MQSFYVPTAALLGLALGACAPTNTMNTPRTGLDTNSVSEPMSVDAPGSVDTSQAAPQLPPLDASAAQILSGGKYETATFALG